MLALDEWSIYIAFFTFSPFLLTPPLVTIKQFIRGSYFKRSQQCQAWWPMPRIPARAKLRQEDLRFEARRSSMARPYLSKQLWIKSLLTWQDQKQTRGELGMCSVYLHLTYSCFPLPSGPTHSLSLHSGTKAYSCTHSAFVFNAAFEK